MTKSKKALRCRKSPPGWHSAFEAMLPRIVNHARIAFRHLDAEAREEAIQETVCNACQAYARLVELGKTDVAFPSALAHFGVRQTKSGRKVGGKLNTRDVLSECCQRKRDLLVERLDRYDPEEAGWVEILVEDKTAGPADTAIARIDFAKWLQILPYRLRRMATFLGSGETTSAAARRFRVSPARISQIRRELFVAWHGFQGDGLAAAVAG